MASRHVCRSHVVFRLALACGALSLLAAQFYTSAGLRLFVGSTLPPPLSCNRNLDIGARVHFKDHLGGRARVHLQSPSENLLWDALTRDRIPLLKQQLRRAPKPNTLELLVKSWKSQGGSGSHVSLADLRGVWELQRDTGTGNRAWDSNFLRMVLDVYDSDFGKRMDMELLSAPRVIVLRDGVTRTVTELKWGGLTDVVMVSGKLERAVEGGFRELPRAFSSKALQVRVPFSQKPRNLHVTYYDGDLLVMQDSSGVVDVLWREGEDAKHGHTSWRTAADQGEQEEEEEEDEEDEEDGGEEDEPEDSEADLAVAEMKVAVRETTSEFAIVKSRLRHFKEQLKGKAGPMSKYNGSMIGQPGKIQDFFTGMKYYRRMATKLAAKQKAERGGKEKAVSVLSRLVDQAKDAVGSLHKKKQEMEKVRKDAQDEMIGLERSAEAYDGEVLNLKGMEESLLFQLPRLKKELNVAPRHEWEAYRAAIASAQEDLKEARLSLRLLQQKQAENEKALKAAAAKFRQADADCEKVIQAFNLMSAKSDRKSQELEAKVDELNSKTSDEESLENLEQALHEYEKSEAALGKEVAEVAKQVESIEESLGYHKRALRRFEVKKATLREDMAQVAKDVESMGREIPQMKRGAKEIERMFQRKKEGGGFLAWLRR